MITYKVVLCSQYQVQLQCMSPTTFFATDLILNSIKGTSFQVMKLAKSEKSKIVKCPKNLTILSIVQNQDG